MRKLLFGLIGLIMLFAWSCSNEQIIEQKVDNAALMNGPLTRATSSGLAVNQPYLVLEDDSVRLAGQVVVSAKVSEVTLQWNLPDSCNVDTTRTHLSIKNGQATLDIKWDKMLDRGNFGPDAMAFDGGVLISDGTTSLYVHLIWTETPATNLYNQILTRSVEELSIVPKKLVMSVTPSELKLNSYNGGSARLKLEGTEFSYLEFDRIGSYTNVSLAGLPEYVDGDKTMMLEFRWKGGTDAAPGTGFKVPYYIASEDVGLNTTAWLRYTIAEEDTLAVIPNEFTVLPAGQTVTTKVTTNDAKWRIVTQNIPSWIQPSAMEGGKGTTSLYFTVAPNTTMLERTFTVYIETSGKSKGIIINQLGFVPTLTVTPQTFNNVSANGAALSLDVKSTVEWSITSTLPDWITANKHTGNGDDTVGLTVAPNTTFENRTATITFSATGIANLPPQTVTVTQLGITALLTVNPTSFTGVSASGATLNANVLSNIDWKISSTLPAWITANKSTGNGNATITFTVVANTTTQDRTYTLTLAATNRPNLTATVVFTQKGVALDNSLTVSASSTNIGSQGGVSTVTITSNTSWSVTSDSSWARVVTASGSGNGISDIVLQENTGSTARTATITIKTTAGAPVISKTITITQQPKGAPVNPGGGPEIGDFEDGDINVGGGEL